VFNRLYSQVGMYCKQQPRACNRQTDSCSSLTAKVSAGYGCTNARELVQQQCPAALVSGDLDYDPEYRDVAHAFQGKHWRELSPAFIREQRDALPLLSPAAFRFFLPAYMLACLDGAQDLDTAPLSVASCLTPPDPHDVAANDAFVRRTLAFMPVEASAICAYLAAVPNDAGVAEPSLARAVRYWRSRCP
jgi:hypothetical protein